MTTKDLANIDNMIELAEQYENAAKTIKNALILLRQAEEEDYLERTDNIKPVSVRLDEASEALNNYWERDNYGD